MILLWCAYLKWEIGNGSFSLQTTIRACVLSLSVVYFVNRKLQDSYFVLFFRMIWGANQLYIAMLCFPVCEKSALTYQIILLQESDHFWSGLHTIEDHYTHAVSTKHWADISVPLA